MRRGPRARRDASAAHMTATRELGGIGEVAARFDAVVFDQWGVLHDGTAAYPGARETVAALRARGVRLAVLSNSGKRADANSARMKSLGYDERLFDVFMTSGEALWLDAASGRIRLRRPFVVAGAAGDGESWAEGLGMRLADRVEDADVILLMGVAEGSDGSGSREALACANARGIPLVCTNPDLCSPRAGGVVQVSPGSLAESYRNSGGDVTYYGKPWRRVFDLTREKLGTEPARMLMVGDSLEHDIAGGQGAGWSTLLVGTGLQDGRISAGGSPDGSPQPDFTIPALGRWHAA